MTRMLVGTAPGESPATSSHFCDATEQRASATRSCCIAYDGLMLKFANVEGLHEDNCAYDRLRANTIYQLLTPIPTSRFQES